MCCELPAPLSTHVFLSAFDVAFVLAPFVASAIAPANTSDALKISSPFLLA